MLIIDAHTHVFPETVPGSTSLDTIKAIRGVSRRKLKPLTESLHRLQPWIRHLSPVPRAIVDTLSTILPIPGLLIESSPEDLLESMKQNEISRSVIVAYPSLIPNEFLIELASTHPEFIPVVVVPPKVKKPENYLKRLYEKGARGVKIHRNLDELSLASKHYDQLIGACTELDIPVILHTGHFQIGSFRSIEEWGDPKLYEPWFKKYTNTRFILVHMNYSQPELAIELAESFPNIYLDTSWQPPESLYEAVRRVGADRVLFSSDWPFVGANQEVCLKKIAECVQSELITPDQQKLILGENAKKLFKVE